MLDLREEVAGFLGNQEDPTTIRGIMRAIGLPNAERQYLKALLLEMVRDGEVTKHGPAYWVPDGKPRSLAIKREKSRAKNELTGRLSVNSKGKGFIANPRGEDWIIPEYALNRAKSGDIVKARRSGTEGSRTIGEVIEVETFGTSLVLGVFERRDWGVSFHPFGDFKIYRKALFDFPNDAEEDMVGRFARREDGTWAFDGFVGRMDDPRIDEEVVMTENGLATAFSSEVEKDVARFSKDFDFSLGDRRDFRDELVFTVDGATARDFDDALHFKRVGKQIIEVGIHIADVSEFVGHGSVLDLWAREQGNSVYLPHRAYPMLPEILSNELCSLKPGVPRYTTSVVVRIHRSGEIDGFEICKGLIQSKYRLTYDEVAAVSLDKNEEERARLAEVAGALDLGISLSRKLKERRTKQGGLGLDMSETVMTIDEEHRLSETRQVWQTDANRMIEAFMCLANECVALHLEEFGIPFRIHDKPEEKRLQAFSLLLESFQIPVPDNLMTDTGPALNQIIRELRGKPNAKVMQTQLLKTLKLAEDNVDNHGHFGLSSTHYAHFTSPIRRYADLYIHQRLRDVLAQPDHGPEYYSSEGLPEICAHISKKERDAAKAEITFKQLKILRRLVRETGNDFKGVISDVKPYGFFVDLDDWGISGLVAVEDLDDFFDFMPEIFALIGDRSKRVFRVGQEVWVNLARVDLIGRKLNLLLLEGRSDEVTVLDLPKGIFGEGRTGRRGGGRKRHGEKRGDGGRDPVLYERGRGRGERSGGKGKKRRVLNPKGRKKRCKK
jgi:ribonuclease R